MHNTVKYIKTQTNLVLVVALTSYYRSFVNGENCVTRHYSPPMIDWQNVAAIFEEVELDRKRDVQLDWNYSHEYRLSLVVASQQYTQHNTHCDNKTNTKQNLANLHRLTASTRIHFKIALLTFKSITT